MNIVCTFNDKFVPQVATSICSICENNKSEKITFYLIADGLSPKNKRELENLIKSYHQKVVITEIGDIRDHFDFDFDTTGWNPVIVTRLLLDKFLPKGINRVLYLDGDTIVRGSISDLYNSDLGDAIIGASIEPTIDREHKESLGISGAYYNSGMLLIDMEKWRKEQIGARMISYYRSHDGRLFAPDQDVINGVLKNRIKTLAPKYNFCTYFMHYPYKFLNKLMRPGKFVSEQMFSESVQNPVIIHFLGEDRPWRTGNMHKYRDDYKKYLAMTPWKDTPEEGGWQLYFFCYNVFSIATKPFPALRYSFLNTFFPVLVWARSRQNRKNGGGCSWLKLILWEVSYA